MIKQDITNMTNKRQENIKEVNESLQQIVKKEIEARQDLLHKWSVIAKEDMEVLTDLCQGRVAPYTQENPAPEAYHNIDD